MNQILTLVVKEGVYGDSKIIWESFCSHFQHAFCAPRLNLHVFQCRAGSTLSSVLSRPMLDPPPWNRLYEFYAAYGEAHQADLSSILSHLSASQRLRSFSVVHTTASFLMNIIQLASVWNDFILVLLTLTSNHWCVLNGCKNWRKKKKKIGTGELSTGRTKRQSLLKVAQVFCNELL